MKRAILGVILVSLVLSPIVGSIAVGQSGVTGLHNGNIQTGRPVGDISTPHVASDRVSVHVTDDHGSGATVLKLNKTWLQDELDRPPSFWRLMRNGELVDEYRVTEQWIIATIPHFSTQNISVSTVDGQFKVSGSAAGGESSQIINYDVNETGIAVLEIHGQGTTEGTQRVDQYFSEVDNQSFTWSTGEIPRNVTLKITGHGEQYGPLYNKSSSGLTDGSTFTFDLLYKDYQPNVTISGAGEKRGTFVTKGPFQNFSSGESENLNFQYDQNNGSVTFGGVETSTSPSTVFNESHNITENGDFDGGDIDGWKTASTSGDVPAAVGSYKIRSSGVDSDTITSTSGLSNYPKDGDEVNLYFKLDDTGGTPHWRAFSGDRYIQIEMRTGSSDDVRIVYTSTGSTLYSYPDGSVGWTSDTWYRVQLSLNSDGSTLNGDIYEYGGSGNWNNQMSFSDDSSGYSPYDSNYQEISSSSSMMHVGAITRGDGSIVDDFEDQDFEGWDGEIYTPPGMMIDSSERSNLNVYQDGGFILPNKFDLISGFESGNLNDWNGDTGNSLVDISSQYADTGSNSLYMRADGNDNENPKHIWSQSGLDSYPERGGSFDAKFMHRYSHSSSYGGYLQLRFGESEIKSYAIEIYTVANQGKISLKKGEAGNATTLDTADLDFPDNPESQWNDISVDYGETTITVTVTNIDGQSATVTADDSEYGSGNIGFYVEGADHADLYAEYNIDSIGLYLDTYAQEGYYQQNFTTEYLENLGGNEILEVYSDYEAQNPNLVSIEVDDGTGFSPVNKASWSSISNNTWTEFRYVLESSEDNTTSPILEGISGEFKVYNSSISGETTNTSNPALYIDGEQVASYTGELGQGEQVDVSITKEFESGERNFQIQTSDGLVDWVYQGNNEARAHVHNFTLNGLTYTVDQFLNETETTTINTDEIDTIQGLNDITLDLYGDSETQFVNRVDARGQYENRAVVDSVTVNGNTQNLDAALADSETALVGVTGVYGDNDVRVQLQENSTQDNYDAALIWYPENRTIFQNVTINGQTFDGPDEYDGLGGNQTFLGSGDVLQIDPSSVLSPGDNDHTFRQLPERTTTDTLDWIEYTNYSKNVSVALTEGWGLYTSTVDEQFDHDSLANTTVTMGIPERVQGIESLDVYINGTTTSSYEYTVYDSNITTTITEDIGAGEDVRVVAKGQKYIITNASYAFRGHNQMDEPYLVSIGASPTGSVVVYNDSQIDPDAVHYEVIMGDDSVPVEEATGVMDDVNISIPESYFTTEVNRFTVQRPQYSTDTWTGVTNTINSTAWISPNRTVRHDPLFAESDETYERVERYDWENVDTGVDLTWETVGAYHMGWTTDGNEEYVQFIGNVSKEEVSVFADGREYADYSYTDGEVRINTSSNTQWDVYMYDPPEITSSTEISMYPGETKTLGVIVENTNDFELKNARLDIEGGWVQSIDPEYDNIGENTTYDVEIEVPRGVDSGTYEMEMNFTSRETGEIDTQEITVDVGSGIIAAGAAFPTTYIAGLLLVVLVVLYLGYKAVKTGSTGPIEDTIEDI